MKDRRIIPGFIAYWLIFGGTSMALIGLDNMEFATLCKLVLLGECLIGMVILLCVLAYFTPDKPRTAQRMVYRQRDTFKSERDMRCRGYISADEIRRAARYRRK